MIDSNRQRYNIAQWGQGYFDIDDAGEVVVKPSRVAEHAGLSLKKLTQALIDAELSLPVLVRFSDILRDRVEALQSAFATAMAAQQYAADYTAAYPIKVNQQRDVVEAILGAPDSQVGLEAGSKPELMAAIAMLADRRGTIICNGYKDQEFIRLALIGQQLGHRVFIILEKLGELDIVLEQAKALGVVPRLGVRVRLASIAHGKWQNTGGEKSKFGLSSAQILAVVEQLRALGKLDYLQLLHFHLGSQVANIRDIRRGLQEAARFFVELQQLGAPIHSVDVGGGLGIDYEGTASRSDCSINYSMMEYARNVVHAFAEVCEQAELKHPHLITESGRSMSAHHAVLITQVTETEKVTVPDPLPSVTAADAPVLQELWAVYQGLQSRAITEHYHDACYWLAESHALYNHGLLTLAERARAEQLYQACALQIRSRLNLSVREHQTIATHLTQQLADKIFVNLSLFQSLPDVWGIDQVFPIMPLSDLSNSPDCRAVLQDLTCDSDGRIDRYVDGHSIESTLPLPEAATRPAALIGVFLVGAYQEILGDMHNLFGDTDAVNVVCAPDGSFTLTHAEAGDTVADVLQYVHYNQQTLLSSYQRQLAASDLAASVQQSYEASLQRGLSSKTYLETKSLIRA